MQDRPLTVVVDLSVLLHQISNGFENAGIKPSDDRYVPALNAQLAYLAGLDWLQGLKPATPERAQVVFACDQKDKYLKYWRHHYLCSPEVVAKIPRKKQTEEKARLELISLLEVPALSRTAIQQERISQLADKLSIHYKAGRKFPDPTFKKIKEDTYKCLEARLWRHLRFTGYEADDVAASIVRCNSALPADRQHNILLVTVDNDWLGLVSDRVAWFESQSRFPRLRDDISLISYWSERREGYPVTEPRQIWDMKTIYGDKSDALPPGSPLEVIDLLGAPQGFRLWEEPGVSFIIGKWLGQPIGVQVGQATSDRAKEYLRSIGLPLAIKPFEPSQAILPVAA